MSLTDIAMLVVFGVILIPFAILAVAAEHRGKRGD
jgi:hypothetical protein